MDSGHPSAEYLQQELEKAKSETQRRATELEKAYAKLDSHLNQTPLAVIEWDHDFRVTMWKGQAESIFGWKAAEVLGRHPHEWDFIYPEDAQEVGCVMEELLTGKPRNISSNRNLTSDGRVVECEWYNSAHQGQEGKVVSIFSLAQDVTERNRALRELRQLNSELERRVQAKTRQSEESLARMRETEQRFRGAFQASATGIALVSLDGHFYEVNDALCKIVGYSREELNELTFQQITHPEDLKADLALAKQLTAGEIPHYQLDKRYLHKNGEVVWIKLSGSVVRESSGNPLYYVAQIEDVTPEKEARQALEASVKEKELLLREVHHRVKNNLQIVTSLLQLQEGKFQGTDLAQPLRDSRDRVRAMALVHESLYRADDLSQVDMKSYLQRLSQPMISGNTRLKIDTTERLPMSVAIPCGLIINELVSNAVKHGGEDGEVTISLVRVHQTMVSLAVDDTGSGFSPNEMPEVFETLGLRLVQALVGQLHGRLEFLPGPGGRVRIEFPLQKAEHGS